MNGLNNDAIEEMLEDYHAITMKIAQAEQSTKYLITESSKRNVRERIEELKKDRDFTYQMLYDEFVLGLYNSAVAIYFGLALDKKGYLVRPLTLYDVSPDTDA